jgi:N-acetylneuraminic acid mutarotase
MTFRSPSSDPGPVLTAFAQLADARSVESRRSSMGLSLAAAGLLFLALGVACIDTSSIPAPVPETESLEWRKVVAEPARPPVLSDFAMAPLGDKVVLFGGSPSAGAFDEGSDTWEWNGRAWTKLDPPVRPPALADHAMATLGNKVVLFGGRHLGLKGGTAPGPMGEPGAPGDEDRFDENWEWDGTTWTRLKPPSSPPGRTHAAMATLGNKVVLFGGQGVTGELLNDTWTWDGTTWTRLDPASPPPPRTAHAMATLGNKVILFGGRPVDYGDATGAGPAAGEAGIPARGHLFDDTWEWDGTNWTQLVPPSSPDARQGHAMATLGNTVILFGGTAEDGATGPLGDPWQWDGTTWTQLDPHCCWPPKRSGHAMATLNGTIVLFGGDTATAVLDANGVFETAPVNDTWEWDGEIWLPRLVSPTGDSPYGNATVVLDGKAVLFMGDFVRGSAWEWDGIGWTALAAPTLSPCRFWGGAMAVRGDKIVLFGGVDDAAATTCEWDGTRWSVRPTPTSPPGRTGHAMAALGGRVFLFGGSADLPAPIRPPDKAGSSGADTSAAASLSEGVTWEWDGATWTELSPPVNPPARRDHAMVTVGNKIVLFGGKGVDGPLNDTWEWDGSTWTSLASPSSPPARAGTALATWNETVVLFGGSDGDVTTPMAFHDTWVLKGGTWTQLTPITYPPARSGHLMASVNGEIVLIGGSSDQDTWLLGSPAK